MTRWKVSVTWHEGGSGPQLAVEAFEDGERVSCVTFEPDPAEQVHRKLSVAAYDLQRLVHPRLF